MTDKSLNRAKGAEGENEAVDFLQSKGYRILERNWVSGKLEIDLIAADKNHIVFVEVKKRFSKQFREPWEAVNRKKQQHIIRAANYYLKKSDHPLEPRFDIISIIQHGNKTEIEHIEQAFWPMA
ncbi:MAG: YraN family protein [Flavobacteriales bacterium]